MHQNGLDLPFQLGQKISEGAFANIYLARDPNSQSPDVYAIKVIDKKGIVKSGRQTVKQIDGEVKLHQLCGSHSHPGIIDFFASDETQSGKLWICMEFASGGDLFDKIEPDLGVPEDIAHFYFFQMMAGLQFIHSKGVSHRDIKPENILLDRDGNLKIADFGLAALYAYKGQRRSLNTCCGSPPYAAPEILGTYDGEKVDVWSAGVVLFALLLGSTPWNEPTMEDPLFKGYSRAYGDPQYSPWTTLPRGVREILQGMLYIDPNQRLGINDILADDWVIRPRENIDGIGLANALMSRMSVDVPLSQRGVETIDDPALSQFTQGTQVLESLTQRAKRFADITGSERLTRFFSTLSIPNIMSRLREVIPTVTTYAEVVGDGIEVQLRDTTGCSMIGRIEVGHFRDSLQYIDFLKKKGDPTQWRRFFKQVTGEVIDIVYAQ